MSRVLTKCAYERAADASGNIDQPDTPSRCAIGVASVFLRVRVDSALRTAMESPVHTRTMAPMQARAAMISPRMPQFLTGVQEAGPGTQFASRAIVDEAFHGFHLAGLPVDNKLNCLLGLSADTLVDELPTNQNASEGQKCQVHVWSFLKYRALHDLVRI